MGNIVVTTGSVFIPLFNKLFTIPFFYHPYRWGKIPWYEPNPYFMSLFQFFLNIIMIAFLATISGLMTTQRECRKHDLLKSFKNSLMPIFGYIVGNILVFMMPFLKAPLLSIFSWVPYSGYLVHGAMVAIFVLIFGAMGNATLRENVCHKK